MDEKADKHCIVRVRMYPWQSSDDDIANFFQGLNIAKDGIAVCLSALGCRNGEALIRFMSREHRDMALEQHKHCIDKHYIEVYRASDEDFRAISNHSEARAFLLKGAKIIIRMQSLPYDCTAKRVVDFFATGSEPCNVLDGVNGILFVKKPNGQLTNKAFVLFANESDSLKALSQHQKSIGQRNIEIYRTTTADAQQYIKQINGLMDPETYGPAQSPLITKIQPVQIPLLPPYTIRSGTSRTYIRLRGLPHEARGEDVLHFLADVENDIIHQIVYMMYNAQGQPTGEAFWQMTSEEAARATVQLKHYTYMLYDKKYCYIQVFQYSGSDMMELNSNLHSPSNPTKPEVLSRDMLTRVQSSPSSLSIPPPPSNPTQPKLLFPQVQQAASLHSSLISFSTPPPFTSFVPPPPSNPTQPKLLFPDMLTRVQSNDMMVFNSNLHSPSNPTKPELVPPDMLTRVQLPPSSLFIPPPPSNPMQPKLLFPQVQQAASLQSSLISFSTPPPFTSFVPPPPSNPTQPKLLFPDMLTQVQQATSLPSSFSRYLPSTLFVPPPNPTLLVQQQDQFTQQNLLARQQPAIAVPAAASQSKQQYYLPNSTLLSSPQTQQCLVFPPQTHEPEFIFMPRTHQPQFPMDLMPHQQVFILTEQPTMTSAASVDTQLTSSIERSYESSFHYDQSATVSVPKEYFILTPPFYPPKN